MENLESWGRGVGGVHIIKVFLLLSAGRGGPTKLNQFANLTTSFFWLANPINTHETSRRNGGISKFQQQS